MGFFPVLYASQFEAEQLIFEQFLLCASFLCYEYEMHFCIFSAGTCLHVINSLLQSITVWCTDYHKNLTATLDRSMTYLVHCSLSEMKSDW